MINIPNERLSVYNYPLAKKKQRFIMILKMYQLKLSNPSRSDQYHKQILCLGCINVVMYLCKVFAVHTKLS